MCTCNRIKLVVLVVSIRVSLGLVVGAEGQNTSLIKIVCEEANFAKWLGVKVQKCLCTLIHITNICVIDVVYECAEALPRHLRPHRL